jgi:DNA-binding GntR family transcriptional regulator
MPNTADPVILPTVELLRSHSLTKVVQDEIERMILSGELPGGGRLNENAVADKLSVSRGPVREACRALAELGFVYLVPNRGFFVKRLDKVEAMEIYDLRGGITGVATSLLAAIITDEQIRQLEDLLAQMDKAANATDFATFHSLNLEFHDFIVNATGNGRLIKTNRALVKEFQLFRTKRLDQREALIESNREHRAIIDALKKRDSLKCYDVSFQHVANGKQRMLNALDGLEHKPSDVAQGTKAPTRQRRTESAKRKRA